MTVKTHRNDGTFEVPEKVAVYIAGPGTRASLSVEAKPTGATAKTDKPRFWYSWSHPRSRPVKLTAGTDLSFEIESDQGLVRLEAGPVERTPGQVKRRQGKPVLYADGSPQYRKGTKDNPVRFWGGSVRLGGALFAAKFKVEILGEAEDGTPLAHINLQLMNSVGGALPEVDAAEGFTFA